MFSEESVKERSAECHCGQTVFDLMHFKCPKIFVRQK